jgi:hypothetical protein
MKVILVEPGESIIQKLADAYMACKHEPITVCGNGIRAVFMVDEVPDEDGMEVLNDPSLVDVHITPTKACVQDNPKEGSKQE